MSNFKGFAYGLVTSVTFGLIPLFTLPLMAEGMRFDSILFYRFLFATFALIGVMMVEKQSFHVDKRDIPVFILLGGLYTISAMFLFWGYSFMAAGIATTLHFTYPVFVAIIMMTAFREKTSWITVVAILLAVLGVARLSIDGGKLFVDPIGVMIVLFSAVGYALYIVTVNKSRVHDMNGRKLTFYVFIVSTCLFFFKAQTNGGVQSIPDGQSWINLILLAVVPTVISNITLVQAVHNIGSTLTAVLGAMEPVTAVCVGVLVFGEPFTSQIATGILLIIVAVTLIILSKYIQKSLRTIKHKLLMHH
ncbi:DMT family transporter [Parabacteroides bouchesdurhonensis]|uniref:DMT family transporter n=1 Tax=Parabacteroides bouchesdurhonensis TaxID=1936995 RepID=UPI000C85C036|nr:DMT family transporter [Parabacteroides bouchesdurhonensis]